MNDASAESGVLKGFFKKFGFALGSTGLLAVVGLIGSFVATDRLVESSEMVAHTNEVIAQAEAVIAHLTDYETGQRGFLLTSDPLYLEPFQSGRQTIANDLYALRRLVADNPAQQKRVDELGVVVKKRTEILDRTVELRLTGKSQEALDIIKSGDGKEFHDEARQRINLIQEVERGLLQERQQDTNTFIFIARCLLLMNGLVVIVTLGWVYLVTRQEFDLRVEAERTAKEIAKRNETLARNLEFSMANASKEIEDLVESGVQRNRLLEMLNPKQNG